MVTITAVARPTMARVTRSYVVDWPLACLDGLAPSELIREV